MYRKIPNIDNVENREIQYVNLNIPIDNMSYTFLIPPNTSDFSITNVASAVPNHKSFYRWVSDIDYRIDTSGIYNITTTQTIIYDTGSGNITVTIPPGFYSVADFNSTPFSDFLSIATSGANAFKAIPKVISGFPTFIDLTGAIQIQAILNWPSFISSPSTFIPVATVDITGGKDLLLIYLSFCRQSSQNNYTNVAAIPINGVIGNAVNGTIHQQTPLLADMDTIASPTIHLRDVNNKPYLINTPILINVKVLFAIKNHPLGF
jgi:hypothetical protein